MLQKDITLHETMQLHEMLNFKTVGIVKAKLIQGLVFDQELRSLLDRDVQHSLISVPKLINLIAEAKDSLEEEKK